MMKSVEQTAIRTELKHMWRFSIDENRVSRNFIRVASEGPNRQSKPRELLARAGWLGIGAYLGQFPTTMLAAELTTLDVAYAGSMGSLMEGAPKKTVEQTLKLELHGRSQGANALAQLTLHSTQFFPPSMPLHKRGVGLLTQDPGLFPHLRVSENVNFGIPNELARNEDYSLWIEALRDRLQLAALWNAPASLISGGPVRRVGLARMLARKPQLILLDEPFTGLDRQLTRELLDDLVFWNQTLGFTMIAVDHEAEVLIRLCPGQAIVIEDGKVVQRGLWQDLYHAPATPSLRSLLAPL
jgi:energy-coupling factor transporter ATP-binding protein EcfA2